MTQPDTATAAAARSAPIAGALATPAAWGRRRPALPVVSEIEAAIRKLEGSPQADGLHGQCLHIAHATATVLHRHGLQPQIQAGSMQWPRMRREEDDGECSTHFAYMWDPQSAASRLSIALGNLPEMHVWVGLVETQELIDFSTRHFRAHAEALGLRWTADNPPNFLWTNGADWPDWVVYTPDPWSTLFARRILNRLYRPEYLEK